MSPELRRALRTVLVVAGVVQLSALAGHVAPGTTVVLARRRHASFRVVIREGL
jgi:hypothetical protein